MHSKSIRWMSLARLLMGLVLAAGLMTQVTAAQAPTPPTQPAFGPGGAERAYPAVQGTSYGERPTGYWLFEPLDAAGAVPDEPLPLVIFLHGFTAVDPVLYGDWIEHIAEGGAIVVFPFYQTLNPLTLRPDEYLDNVNTAVADALVELEKPGHAQVDLSRVAVVGHSAGGVLTVDYAATAAENGLPVPSAIMPVEPGGCKGCTSDFIGRFGTELQDLSNLDPSTKAIVVAGDADEVVGTEPAEFIWSEMTSLEPGNRDYVLIHSDDHGEPALVANHLMPLDKFGGEVNALDWYGTWKLFDALMDCAFYDKGCDQALGGTEFQTFMGVWSDGTPVVPATVQSA